MTLAADFDQLVRYPWLEGAMERPGASFAKAQPYHLEGGQGSSHRGSKRRPGSTPSTGNDVLGDFWDSYIADGPWEGARIKVLTEHENADGGVFGVYLVDGVGYVFAWGDGHRGCAAEGIHTPPEQAIAEAGSEVYDNRADALRALRYAWEEIEKASKTITEAREDAREIIAQKPERFTKARSTQLRFAGVAPRGVRRDQPHHYETLGGRRVRRPGKWYLGGRTKQTGAHPYYVSDVHHAAHERVGEDFLQDDGTVRRLPSNAVRIHAGAHNRRARLVVHLARDDKDFATVQKIAGAGYYQIDSHKRRVLSIPARKHHELRAVLGARMIAMSRGALRQADHYHHAPKPARPQLRLQFGKALRITDHPAGRSVVITGDTYARLKDLRSLKAKLGRGVWNKHLKGWIFPKEREAEVRAHLGLEEKGRPSGSKPTARPANEAQPKQEEPAAPPIVRHPDTQPHRDKTAPQEPDTKPSAKAKRRVHVAGHWRASPEGRRKWVRDYFREVLGGPYRKHLQHGKRWNEDVKRLADQHPPLSRDQHSNLELLGKHLAAPYGVRLTHRRGEHARSVAEHVAQGLAEDDEHLDVMERNKQEHLRRVADDEAEGERRRRRVNEAARKEEAAKEAAAKKAYGQDLARAVLNGSTDPSAINMLIGIMAEREWLYLPTRGKNKGVLIPNAARINKDWRAQQDMDAVTKTAYGIADNLKRIVNDKWVKWRQVFEEASDIDSSAALRGGRRYWHTLTKQGVSVAAAIHRYNVENDATLRPFFADDATTVKDILKEHGAEAAKEALGDIHAVTHGDRDRLLEAQKNETWRKPKRMSYAPIGNHRPHNFQKAGVNWCVEAKRGIIAFGTGLGKTLTAIMTAERLRQKGQKRSIMLVPNQKVMDWVEDIRGFVPGAKVAVVAGTPAERKAGLEAAKKAEYVVVAHSIMRNVKANETKQLEKIDGAVFIDEAHNFSGKGTKGFYNVRALLGSSPKKKGWRQYAFGLTATPSTKYPDRYFDFVQLFAPGVLGNLREFEAKHMIQITEGGKGGEAMKLWKDLDRVHEELQPWVFHKYITDPDVAIELPKLHHNPQWHDIPREMRPHYANAMAGAFAALNDVTNPGRMPQTVYGAILKSIHEMRAVAISPNVILDQVEGAERYEGPEPKLDAAAQTIAEHFENPKNAHSPTIVLGEWNRPFDLLKQKLKDGHGFSDSDFVEISGRVRDRDVDKAIKATKSGATKVCFLNVMKGGEGLNMQGKARSMIFLHEPWRHDKVDQAIARLWRQGQKHNVTVTTHGLNNSIDATIHERIGLKRAVADALAGRPTTTGALKVGKTTFWDLVRLAALPKSMALEICRKFSGMKGANELKKDIERGKYRGTEIPRFSQEAKKGRKKMAGWSGDVTEHAYAKA